jgi:hypothetical protein
LTELDPMSRPTRLFALRNSTLTFPPDPTKLGNPNTSPSWVADPTNSALNTEIGGSRQRDDHRSAYICKSLTITVHALKAGLNSSPASGLIGGCFGGATVPRHFGARSPLCRLVHRPKYVYDLGLPSSRGGARGTVLRGTLGNSDANLRTAREVDAHQVACD